MTKLINRTNSRLEKTLAHWHETRQSVIVSFNELCALKPFLEQDANSIQAHLDAFCEQLMDFIAQGQFEVFEQMLRFYEELQTVCEIDLELFNQLLDANAFVRFNDKYALAPQIDELEGDLSRLGVSLAQRLELEDLLLERYTEVQAEYAKL